MKRSKKYTLFFLMVCLCALFLWGCGSPNAKTDTNDPETASVPVTAADTIVHTKYGLVRGLQDPVEDVITFKGVPFATPPVGHLRFQPPQELESWDGALDCTKIAPRALQPPRKSYYTYSEDCLYLNIWAPNDALEEDKKYPVLVFIHGGAYAQGSPSGSRYDGSAFARDGVIQVNIAYRLNALGFINDPSMGESGGNLGTLDQIAALEWIQDNIGAFGGDPDNVTIAGESAGAFSVSAMMFSPKAKGLFHRAILQSGNLLSQPILSPHCNGDDTQSKELTRDFLESLHADSLRDLLMMDGLKITDASAFSLDLTEPKPYGFFPSFNGSVLPKDPYRALRRGYVNKVPVMTGFNTDEGSRFIPEGQKEKDYKTYVKDVFGSDSKKVLKRFPVNEKHSATDRLRQLVTYGFYLGSSIFSDELSRQGIPVYQYQYDYHLPSLDKKGLGVAHASELNFIFDTHRHDAVLPEDADAFLEEIRARWLGFIKTGNPNSELKKMAQEAAQEAAAQEQAQDQERDTPTSEKREQAQENDATASDLKETGHRDPDKVNEIDDRDPAKDTSDHKSKDKDSEAKDSEEPAIPEYWPRYTQRGRYLMKLNEDSHAVKAPHQEDIAFLEEVLWAS